MNDHAYGTVTEPGTVRLERVLPGPIERLWEYLVDSDKRGRWLAAGHFEPRVGGRVELRFTHANISPEKEIPDRYKDEPCDFEGSVTRWEPPRVLAYTWAESLGGESEVTFELTARGNDVFLVITHRKLADRALMLSVAAGWDVHVGILEDLLAGNPPRGFWSNHARLEREYAKRI